MRPKIVKKYWTSSFIQLVLLRVIIFLPVITKCDDEATQHLPDGGGGMAKEIESRPSKHAPLLKEIISCSDWCTQTKTISWTDKCTNNPSSCGGCHPCRRRRHRRTQNTFEEFDKIDPTPTTTIPPSYPCATWCPNHVKSWDEKCTWKKNCAGCSECFSATPAPSFIYPCKAWCPNHVAPWSEKCKWGAQCAGCDECREDEESRPAMTTVKPTKMSKGETLQPTRFPTRRPTVQPTVSPSQNPTESPTIHSTTSPTINPTKLPTNAPTRTPTVRPTNTPTASPTGLPSAYPTPSPTPFPTLNPTPYPTDKPTVTLSTHPSLSPTNKPSPFPTTTHPTPLPTLMPVTLPPTKDPTGRPSTSFPTPLLTENPTTKFPTNQAMITRKPNRMPITTRAPTRKPNRMPITTREPLSSQPTITIITLQPTITTSIPTPFPTRPPISLRPTNQPTSRPTSQPTPQPTSQPTPQPTTTPTSPPTPFPILTPPTAPIPTPPLREFMFLSVMEFDDCDLLDWRAVQLWETNTEDFIYKSLIEQQEEDNERDLVDLTVVINFRRQEQTDDDDGNRRLVGDDDGGGDDYGYHDGELPKEKQKGQEEIESEQDQQRESQEPSDEDQARKPQDPPTDDQARKPQDPPTDDQARKPQDPPTDDQQRKPSPDDQADQPEASRMHKKPLTIYFYLLLSFRSTRNDHPVAEYVTNAFNDISERGDYVNALQEAAATATLEGGSSASYSSFASINRMALTISGIPDEYVTGENSGPEEGEGVTPTPSSKTDTAFFAFDGLMGVVIIVAGVAFVCATSIFVLLMRKRNRGVRQPYDVGREEDGGRKEMELQKVRQSSSPGRERISTFIQVDGQEDVSTLGDPIYPPGYVIRTDSNKIGTVGESTVSARANYDFEKIVYGKTSKTSLVESTANATGLRTTPSDDPAADTPYSYTFSGDNATTALSKSPSTGTGIISAADDAAGPDRQASAGSLTEAAVGKVHSQHSLISDDASFEEQYMNDDDYDHNKQTDAAAGGHWDHQRIKVTPSDDKYNDDSSQVRLEFHVPPGKLGVVLYTPRRDMTAPTPKTPSPPIVHAIRDASVLAGRVRLGDALISVDGLDTTNMTDADVSRLLGSRSHNPIRRLVFIGKRT